MSSMQTLQHKLTALQGEHDKTAEKLKRLRIKLASEADESQKFDLEQSIEEAESKLEELGQKIDDLDEKIKGIESGQFKLNDILKQEDLQLPAKTQSPSIPPVAWIVGLGAMGVFAIGFAINGSNGRLANPSSDTATTSPPPIEAPGENTTTSAPPPSQPPAGLDSRFAGTWTTEGDIDASYLMHLNLEISQDGKLSGTLTSSKKQEGAPPSGEMNVLSTEQGVAVDAVGVTVSSYVRDGDVSTGAGQVTKDVCKAELKLKDGNLIWRSLEPSESRNNCSTNFFPPETKLHKSPAPSP